MGTMSALQKPQTDPATKRSLSYVWQRVLITNHDFLSTRLGDRIYRWTFLFNSELLEQSKHLTDAAEMLVQQKMDKLKGAYNEAIDNLKAVSSQLTDLPATDLIKKVDQIVS